MTAMDLFCLLFILFLIKLSGTQDVSTVRKISIQRGQSIIIPCLYKQENTGVSASCYRVTNTQYFGHQYIPKPVFLSDDKAHKILIFRMDQVQESGDYMCVVYTPSRPYIQANFSLEVTNGHSGLHVSSQNLTGFKGDSLTVTCYHQGQVNVTWCKFGGSCVTGTTGTLDRASVEIRHYRMYMSVTMSNLKRRNSGWYWCSSRDLQMPVYVTVKQKSDLFTTTTDLSQITTTSRNRAGVIFLLPVILEVFLIIIIYAALKLFRLYREKCFQSTNQEAEESQYVIMHRKRSSHSRGNAAAGEQAYENMTDLKSVTELTATSYKSSSPAVVKRSYLPNMPQWEPEYVNVIKT